MKYIFFLLATPIVGVAFYLFYQSLGSYDVEKIQVASEFGERPDVLIYRNQKTNSNPRPLIVVLHGHFTPGWLQETYLGFKKELEQKDFILVVPTGAKDQHGHYFWNDEILDHSFILWHEKGEPQSSVKDIAFIDHVIEEVSKRYAVDMSQIFLVGHSNGAFMAFSYACQGNYPINTVVSLAGSITSKLTCDKHFSVIQIHGNADPIVPYEGRENYFYSAQKTMDFWLKLNNCDETFQELENIDITWGRGQETSRKEWNQCHFPVSHQLWTIERGRHIPLIKSTLRQELLKQLTFE